MRRSLPVATVVTILEAVARAGGTISGDTLFLELRKLSDISFSEFLRFLMILELRGLIRVTTTTEDRFFVHLTEKAVKILTTKEEIEE